MRVAIIRRDPENSPNMVSNDEAILQCIKEELEESGADVIFCDSNEIPDGTDAVCHMSRNAKVLEALEIAERQGIKVLNSPKAVRNCSRARIMTLLKNSGIPQPVFHMIENQEELEKQSYPAWIKRGNGWSCHKEDTCYVLDKDEAVAVMKGMKERGIESYVYTMHCEGDIIKFYGVGDSFFSYFYPNPEQTKFGLEKINGTARKLPFDKERMRDMVFKAAKCAGLEIYGGDCIVDEVGNIIIIDLNDFPSFSAVRREAAREISNRIVNSITVQQE